MKTKQVIQSLATPLLQRCHGRISHVALRMALNNLTIVRTATTPLPPCTGTFYGSIGVPCRHTIKRHYNTNEPLNPNQFHHHWHFHRDTAPLPPLDERFMVQDPEMVRPRRRRRNEHGNEQPALRGLRRIPSNHEITNEKLDQRARNADHTAQAGRGKRLRDRKATARGRGIQRGRGRGVGRREGGGEIQEVPGGAYIQFQV
jgi:hypothetical protein